MIHNAWGVSAGDHHYFRSVADRLETQTGAIGDIFVSRTKNSAQKVREWMDAETWFYGKDAVSSGFADSVVANQLVAAKYDPSRHSYKNAPTTLTGTPARDAFSARLKQMAATLARSRAKAA